MKSELIPDLIAYETSPEVRQQGALKHPVVTIKIILITRDANLLLMVRRKFEDCVIKVIIT